MHCSEVDIKLKSITVHGVVTRKCRLISVFKTNCSIWNFFPWSFSFALRLHVSVLIFLIYLNRFENQNRPHLQETIVKNLSVSNFFRWMMVNPYFLGMIWWYAIWRSSAKDNVQIYRLMIDQYTCEQRRQNNKNLRGRVSNTNKADYYGLNREELFYFSSEIDLSRLFCFQK